MKSRLSEALGRAKIGAGLDIARRPLSDCFFGEHPEAPGGVFVKALRSTRPGVRANFLREIDLLLTMNGQAGFPRLIVASRAKGATFHACARIDAPSFAQMVGAQALGDLDDILRHGVGLARWIASFHARSYAHRDLSPEHVFATSPDQVTVVDLGLAKSLTGLSKRERSLCEGADIVSWGMIIWEMIRGSPIFSYQQPELRFELRSQRALISAVEMPEGLAQVLLRALDVSSIFTPNEEEQDGLFTACDLLAALDAL